MSGVSDHSAEDIGKQTAHRTLSRFVISQKKRSLLSELRNLNNLKGVLHISNLDLVLNPQEAAEANLSSKIDLQELVLHWGNHSNIWSSRVEQQVLELLHPHTSLKKLKIEGYKGKHFPAWIGNSLFKNLTTIVLLGCKRCACLPPLGQLPLLEALYIKSMDSVELLVDCQLCGQGPTKFPSLQKLHFERMPRLQAWASVNEACELPVLQELVLKDCSDLRQLTNKHPCLTKLVIEGSPWLLGLPTIHSLQSLDMRASSEMIWESVPRGVKAIRFTPDGRWVVSGGEDNVVKLWDLTAGKLLHDFKGHEGQVQCIDFHPHEFLLATGSADRTVKFWDLETFELIGSAGPELQTSGVRAMTFNPDGRTLLCGLHESLKVLSWEPIRCHDTVDVGWSRLSDLNIHEGKLLGCSYNQSCVGVWVVDISRIEPYAVASTRNGNPESKSTPSDNLPLTDHNIKANMGRLSVSQNSELVTKETKPTATGSVPSTPQRVGINTGSKAPAINPSTASGSATLKKSSSKTHSTTNPPKSDVVPVIVPRTTPRVEPASDFRKESGNGRTLPYNIQSKMAEMRRFSSSRDDSDRANTFSQYEFTGNRNTESNESTDPNFFSATNEVSQPVTAGDSNTEDVRYTGARRLGVSPPMEPSPSYRHENYEIRGNKPRDASSLEVRKGGRTRLPSAGWDREEQSPISAGQISGSSSETIIARNMLYTLRRRPSTVEKETVSASDEDAIADLMEQHDQFISSSQSRLTKLQVVRRLWERNDFRGVINAMDNMSDHAVSADVLSVLSEKSDIITLDLCTCLLPLLTGLLVSKVDRHLGISLDVLLKLVRTFGSVIHSTLSANRSSVGVDLQAEQRLERCHSCFIELEKIKRTLPALFRRGGLVTKSAQELNLALQEVL